ncbi:MAG: hypothetical protein CVT65_11710 [Actinobacteria bacterium HGW-Actinobacteria-5]|nr:MAG: hypothetical protein CVT65_11710 [Actinobacteria bacterium HGW-Actinobacteria-5]
MTEPRRLPLTGCMIALALLTGCTTGPATADPSPTTISTSTPSPSATSASGTPTPTSTSTWNATQTAAIKVVEDYFDAKERLLADPSQFSTAEAKGALSPLLGADMLEGNLTLFKQLKARKERYEGSARLAWTSASGIFGSGAGESVNVTVCRDPQGQTLVDASEKVLAKIPASIREFEVAKGTSGFLIVGEKEGFGDPCP